MINLIKKNKVIILLVIFIILWIIIKPLYTMSVSGNSMAPTLKDKDILFGYSQIFKNPVKGDIVVINSPKDWELGDNFLIKRIIAEPGDLVTIQYNRLYINHNFNRYIKSDKELEFIVPENKYFILGDNNGHSADSLYFLNKNKEYLINKSNIKAFTFYNPQLPIEHDLFAGGY